MPTSHLLTKAALAVAALMYMDSKHYISKDLKDIVTGVKVKRKMLEYWNDMEKNEPHFSSYAALERIIREYPNKEAFVFCDRSSGQLELQRWTYAQIEQEIARVADWYISKGVKAKDVVAVYLPNSPQFFFTYWALAKLNAIGALINSNQTGVPLTHSITLSKANLVIAHSTNYNAIREIEADLPHNNVIILHYSEPAPEKCPYEVVNITDLAPTGASDTVRNTLRVSPFDNICYIYTSGTTGLPKAVAIPHRQCIMPMLSQRYSGHVYHSDRWYCCLPMYHSSALLIAMCGIISVGGTFVLSTKFSSTNCMEDISKSESTGLSYIGEIARYLTNSKPTPYDREHKLRFAFGNGLSKSVWEKFRERFNIPTIIEFYGATEGNAFLRTVNTGPDGVGCVAHRGVMIRKLAPTLKIVKQDPDTLEPYRDPKTGFCVEAEFDEPGEILGEQIPIIAQSREYVDNQKANDKVIMHDVFTKGDTWHRQGDMLKMNRDGWIEFVDRVGDTFRWRGENVSTMEVAAVIGLHPDIQDVTVYGISLPKYEGQMGMATIVSSHPERVANELRPFLQKKGLPLYAHPRFVRIIDVIPVTQTHKHQKAGLKKDGISVYNSCTIYMMTDDGQYVKLNDQNYKTVSSGVAML